MPSDSPSDATSAPAGNGVGTALAPATLSPSDSVKVQSDLWQHRRAMAFVALGAILAAIPGLFLLCALSSDAVVARVSQLQALLIGLIVPLVGLAAAYMGLATVYGANTASTLTTPKG